MDSINQESPIIIIGMHRTGTTMIAGMLEQLGVFIGADKDENNESLFFIELNDWMLKQTAASWDSPNNSDLILKNRHIRRLNKDYIELLLKSHWLKQYLGFKRYVTGKGLNKFEHWGWKDPRNTLLLPLWLDIFPNARVINVNRHGLDVASSLSIRAKKELKQGTEHYLNRKKIGYYSFRKKKIGFTGSLAVQNISYGIGLWDFYCDKANKFKEESSTYLDIKYEVFLNNPVEELKKILDFLKVTYNQSKLEKVAGEVNIQRQFAYRSIPELNLMENIYKEVLLKHGY